MSNYFTAINTKVVFLYGRDVESRLIQYLTCTCK